MRILYLSPWFPYPLDTGSRVRVYHLLRALAGRHRVTLLTLDPKGWAPADVEALAPLCEEAIRVPRDPFCRGRWRLATRFLSLRPVVAVPFPQVVRRAQALHAREPFDLVVAATGVMAAYALALPGVVRVLEEHNSLTRMLWDRYRAQTSALQRLRCWASWRKAALYEARLFRRFDLVTMVSELDAAGGRGLLPARSPPVEVFANGVDCDAFRPGLAGPQPGRLVFGGALSYQANYEAVEFFLGAVLPQVRARCPGAHLRVTGSTTGADLDGLPLGGAVTLTGFLDDVRPEVAAAWAAVVPILSGGGTRLKVLEAMALGTPVVSTPKGAEGLDVSPEHDILLAEGAAGFAGATVEVLEDPALRRRLAANARRLVERRYDWGAIGRRFRERLEVLVEAAQDREQREA